MRDHRDRPDLALEMARRHIAARAEALAFRERFDRLHGDFRHRDAASDMGDSFDSEEAETWFDLANRCVMEAERWIVRDVLALAGRLPHACSSRIEKHRLPAAAMTIDDMVYLVLPDADDEGPEGGTRRDGLDAMRLAVMPLSRMVAIPA